MSATPEFTQCCECGMPTQHNNLNDFDLCGLCNADHELGMIEDRERE